MQHVFQQNKVVRGSNTGTTRAHAGTDLIKLCRDLVLGNSVANVDILFRHVATNSGSSTAVKKKCSSGPWFDSPASRTWSWYFRWHLGQRSDPRAWRWRVKWKRPAVAAALESHQVAVDFRWHCQYTDLSWIPSYHLRAADSIS